MKDCCEIGTEFATRQRRPKRSRSAGRGAPRSLRHARPLHDRPLV